MNKQQLRNSLRELDDKIQPLPCDKGIKAAQEFCNSKDTLGGLFPYDIYTYWAYILDHKPELMPDIEYVPYLERKHDNEEWRALSYLKEFDKLPPIPEEIPDIELAKDRKEYSDWVKLLLDDPAGSVNLLTKPDERAEWLAKGSPASKLSCARLDAMYDKAVDHKRLIELMRTIFRMTNDKDIKNLLREEI